MFPLTLVCVGVYTIIVFRSVHNVVVILVQLAFQIQSLPHQHSPAHAPAAASSVSLSDDEQDDDVLYYQAPRYPNRVWDIVAASDPADRTEHRSLEYISLDSDARVSWCAVHRFTTIYIHACIPDQVVS